MSSSGTGYMYNNAALYVSGAMALSQSAYLSWGGGLNDTTSVGFFQNKNGTLMFKDHTTGSWTELGNTRDNTQLGDAVSDIVTSNGQFTASVGAFMASGKKLRLGAPEESIYGDGTDIHFEVGSNGDINIPANIGLTFGDDGEKIEGDGTDLTISGGGITLDSEGDINIDADESTVYFKDAGTVYARLSSDQGFTVNGALAVSGSVTLGDAAADVATVTAQLAADIITSTGQLTASVGITSDGLSYFNSNVNLGNAAADIITSTGQLTASVGIKIATSKKLRIGADEEYISGDGTDLTIASGGDIILNPTGNDVLPPTDNDINLGSGAKRWANIYTADLHLKNDRGDWTIVEEEDYLCVVNNKTNKRYKMMLEEIQD